MGYDHSLSTAGKLKESVTLDQLVAAFKPLFKYFGYDGLKAFQGTEDLYDSHEFHWLPDTREFSVYTCGDVSYDFDELVKDVAKELGPLVEQPDEFELKNFDTADLDAAITLIVYGDSPAAANRFIMERDTAEALGLLEEHLTTPTLQQIRALIKGELDPLAAKHVSMLETVQDVLQQVMLDGNTGLLTTLFQDVNKVLLLQPKAA